MIYVIAIGIVLYIMVLQSKVERLGNQVEFQSWAIDRLLKAAGIPASKPPESEDDEIGRDIYYQ